ncbi:MAG: undecaprenyl-diphosphate phosphatase [Clostridia bacterium]|nr:undecaprenyl-diphosphate phosphatase [Clostridia bacterium]
MTTFMEILKSLLFGILEGITEWLPISSTGHLILLEEFVSFKGVSENFSEMFNVVIQLGAILAVAVIFFKKIWPFSIKEGKVLGIIRRDKLTLWLKIIVACMPAAVVGLLFDDIIDAVFYNALTVGIMLIAVGIAFIVVERHNRNKEAKVDSLESLTWVQALGIGMFQLIAAILPGTSRSGSTILGGLMLGVSRTTAAEFTFFLGIPVMFGASLLKLVKFGFAFTAVEAVILLVGMVSAFAVSMVCIRFLMDYIKKHDFKIFAYYRIVLGAVVLAYFAIKTLAV